jgi:sec-independent protein translocase protein TatB
VFFGLTIDKVVVIGIIAVFVLGPERVPQYAAQLARLVKSVREMANGARDRMRDEMGPDFDDVDWKKLDPRQYDPRRIIREALLDDEPSTPVVRPAAPSVERQHAMEAGLPTPFDAEST